MAPYLELVGVLAAASLFALLCGWLYTQVLLCAMGLNSRVARLGIGMSAGAAFTAAGCGALLFVPISIEHLRLFVGSGWLPRIWWAVCVLAALAPTVLCWPRAKRQIESRRLDLGR